MSITTTTKRRHRWMQGLPPDHRTYEAEAQGVFEVGDAEAPGLRRIVLTTSIPAREILRLAEENERLARREQELVADVGHLNWLLANGRRNVAAERQAVVLWLRRMAVEARLETGGRYFHVAAKGIEEREHLTPPALEGEEPAGTSPPAARE